MKRFIKFEKRLLLALLFTTVLFPGLSRAAGKVKGRVYLITADYIDLSEGERLSEDLHITNRATYSYSESQSKILVVNGKKAKVYSLDSITGIPEEVLDELAPGNINISRSLIKKIGLKRIGFPSIEFSHDPDLQDVYTVEESEKEKRLVITQKYHTVRPTYAGSRLVRNITRVWKFKFLKSPKKGVGKGELKVTDDYKAIGDFGFAYFTGMKGKVKAYYLGSI